MKMQIQTKDGHIVKNLNRRKAIREYCLNCSGFSLKIVKDCVIKECDLYPYRIGDYDNSEDRSSSIRKKCLNCCNNHKPEVLKCTTSNCALWAYRKSGIDRSLEIKS